MRNIRPEEIARELVATIRRGPSGTVVKLEIVKMGNGRPFLNLREFARRHDGDWFPTKKGITVSARELPEFSEAFTQAAEKLLVTEDDPIRRERLQALVGHPVAMPMAQVETAVGDLLW